MLSLLRRKRDMPEFKKELILLIQGSDIDSPYDQDEKIPDSNYHFAKDLVNDYPDTDEMLDAVSNILMQNGQNPADAAQEFLDICISAINTSGAGLPKEITQHGQKVSLHGRKTKTNTVKDLEKLLKKCKDFKEALKNEPAPQMIEVTLMSRFRFENKTNEEHNLSSPVFLNSILRRTEDIISQRIENVKTNDNFFSNKPNLNKFIISIHQSFLEKSLCALKHKHIVTVTLACTPFSEVDENNVKQAIYSIKNS